MAIKVESIFVELGIDLSDFQKGLSQAAKNLSGFSKKMRDVGKGLTLKVSAPLAALGGFALKASADLETLKVAFESMTGSAQKAAQIVKDLTDFTARTPFQMEGVGASAKQLLAFGVQSDDLVDTLGLLGDIAAGANVPLTDMAQIFGKARAKGKLMTEELLQLSERGVPIIDTLAERLGVTKQEIFDLASKSKISFDLMVESFEQLTGEGGVFANQMEKQSKTLAGLFSTLKDNVILALAAIGDELVETFDLKQLTSDLISGIQDVVKWFKNLDPVTKKVAIVMAAVAAAIGPVLLGIGLLISPIGLVVAGLTLITTAIAGVVTAWDEIEAAIVGVGKKVLQFMGFWTGQIVAFFEKLITEAELWLVGKLTGVLNDMLGMYNSVLEFFGANPIDLIGERTIERAEARLVYLNKKLAQSFDDYADTTTEGVKKVEEAWNPLKVLPQLGIGLKPGEDVSSALSGATETLLGLVAPAIDMVQSKFHGFGETVTSVTEMVRAGIRAQVESFAEWTGVTTTVLEDFQNLSTSVFQTFTDGIGAAIADTIVFGKSLAQALSNLLRNVAKMVIQTLIKMAIQRGIAAAMGITSAKIQAAGEAGSAVARTFRNQMASMSAAPFPTNLTAPAVAGKMAAITAGGGGAVAAALGGGLPGLAKGGIVTRPTLAVIGEAGPEVVAPLEKANRMMGPTQQTIITNLDGREVARTVVEHMPDVIEVDLGLQSE